MTDSAFVAFRDYLRQEHTAEEIAAALLRTVEACLQPSFVELRLDHGLGAAPPIAPEDPLVGYALRHGGTLAVATADVASPVLDEWRGMGAELVVPLVSQGALVGLMVLGPGGGSDGYGVDDRRWLEDLAAYAAAALRIAWLTHQHEASERAWESNAEELRIAQAIQRSLLPKELPALAGWQIATHYQPARVVGGDLYDFIPLPGDLLGVVFGDASDKSVPAALMMATARTLLRASAQRLVLPAQVLARVNEALAAQLPPGTFVTCFFAILDPASGRLRFANAGQTAPHLLGARGVAELRASGFPLGMMPAVTYDEEEVTLAPGETVLFYSDGLLETHAPDGTMFGGPHLKAFLAGLSGGSGLIEAVRTEHGRFAGPEWDQEDDFTLVTLARLPEPARVLAEFDLPSVAGNEMEAMERVEEAVSGLGLSARRLERLKTAVAETVMNATEHGNRNRPDVPVDVQVLLAGTDLRVRVTDRGAGLPDDAVEPPDLAAKLAGRQSPRGWGMFLTDQMVDAVERTTTANGYVVELVVHLTDEAAAVAEAPLAVRRLA
jgi:serine phosphatase RsbU (regulator of sigma subunit)/anti-sigma regulatory factor (Ser/Thr protein kinase)